MEESSNPWGLVSLVLGVLTWILWFVGFCAGMIIPLANMFTFFLACLTAFGGLVTGFLGYRAAMTADGAGRAASLGGLALSLSWGLLQVVLVVIGFLMVGSILGLGFLAVILDAASR